MILGVGYHGEDNPALPNNFLETGLGNTSKCLQGIAACHCAVGIDHSGDFFGDQMALQVCGHCQAHGAEAVLDSLALFILTHRN